jgi:hypothetical protein
MADENDNPEIVGWTGWNTAERRIEKGEYKKANRKYLRKFRKCLTDYFLLHKYILIKKLFTGSNHQNAPRGVPLIKYKNDIYAYMTTMRRWGDLVAKAMSIIDNKDYKSFDETQNEIEKSIKENREMTRDDNTYDYTNFAWLWERPPSEKNETAEDG